MANAVIGGGEDKTDKSNYYLNDGEQTGDQDKDVLQGGELECTGDHAEQRVHVQAEGGNSKQQVT